MINNIKVKISKEVLLSATLFFVAFMIIGARNLDPIFYPTLYAEDGRWTADLLTNGFFETTFESRTFPIIGFTTLYAIGLALSGLLFDAPLFYLPLVYYVISNVFMAGLATVAYWQARSMLSIWSATAILIAVVFLPVGIDGNEIYGRILNLGFFFPYLQMLLLMPLMSANSTKIQKATAIFISLFSVLTFPVGMAISCVAATVLFIRFWYEGRHKEDAVMAFMLLCIGLMPLLVLSGETFSDKGGANLPFKIESFIEFAIARSAIYLGVFSFYEVLNDVIVVFVGSLLFGIVLRGFLCIWKKNRINENKDGFEYVLLFLLGSAALYLMAMIVMRPGLTSLFDDYSTTWPDRYFTGLNLAIFTAIIFAVDRIRLGRLIVLILALPLILTAGKRIELAQPAFKFDQNLSWTGEICHAALVEKGAALAVPIPPNGWFANLPMSAIDDSLTRRCRNSNQYDIPFLGGIVSDVSIQKGTQASQVDMAVLSVAVNNGVKLTVNDKGQRNVQVTGDDPSIVLELDTNRALAQNQKMTWMKITMDKPDELQLFYLKTGDANYSEQNSIRVPLRRQTDQFHIIFGNTVDARKFRIDFPEGVGRSYLLEFMSLQDPSE